MRKILLIALSLSFIFTACKKTDFDDTITGEAVGPLTLKGASSDSVFLNAAVPNQTVKFEWTAAAPGVNSTVNYRWIASLKSVNKFDAASRILEVPSDNNGTATTLTLTHKQLDDLLKAKNFSAGQRVELTWSVEAYNDKSGSSLANSSNVFIVRRMFDNGATPFQIFAPVNSLTPLAIDPNSTSSNLTFNWTRSMPATSGPAIRYQVLFAERKVDASGNELPVNWNAPLFRINSNNNGSDTFVNVSYKAMDDSLTKYGFTNQALPTNLKWTVSATSGTWSQLAEFSNSLSIVREVKVFIVGGATPIGWTPTNALELRQDRSKPGVFYIYTELKDGNNGFKFLSMKADWGAAGQTEMAENNTAESSGNVPSNNTGNLRIGGGANIAVPNGNGIYRVTVDLNNNKYYVQTATSNGIGGMGMIGSFLGSNWPQPAVKMDYVAVNRFNYLTNMSTGTEFKFHDGNAWDNSGADKSRWFGLNGSDLLEDNAGTGNMQYNGPTGLVRTIWDGTDVNNLRYTIIPGKLYAIGGDAGLGNWNNSAGNTSMPEFTYFGNGKWQATITVSSDAQFKLVMEKGNWDLQWGAGSTPGTMVMRYYDADPSTFQFPGAGTYTVTVDEYAGTISW